MESKNINAKKRNIFEVKDTIGQLGGGGGGGGGGGDLLQHPPPGLSWDSRWNRSVGGDVAVGIGIDTVDLHLVNKSFDGRELLGEVSQPSFQSVELLVEVA